MVYKNGLFAMVSHQHGLRISVRYVYRATRLLNPNFNRSYLPSAKVLSRESIIVALSYFSL